MTQSQYIDAFMEGVKAAFEIINGKEPDDTFREIGLTLLARKITASVDHLIAEEEPDEPTE